MEILGLKNKIIKILKNSLGRFNSRHDKGKSVRLKLGQYKLPILNNTEKNNDQSQGRVAQNTASNMCALELQNCR